MWLVAQSVSPRHASAAPDDQTWTPVPLPADGPAGGWVLAAGSDIRYLTVAADGTLYCYATPTATTDTLFKSGDGGLTWASVGHVRDAIVDIAVLPQDPTTVYYTTDSRVYRSTDAGATFAPFPGGPGGAGTGNVRITSLAAIRLGSGNLVAVSTQDADTGQWGGVYLFDEGALTSTWQDAAVGNYDALRVCFSPQYGADGTMVAVVTDGTDTFVRTRVGTGGWGAARGDARIGGVTVTAVVAFPPEYTAPSAFFIGLDMGTGAGDVYRIVSAAAPGLSTATPLRVAEGGGGADVCSLVVENHSPAPSILAGDARNARVFASTDGGTSWTISRRPPSGQTATSVALAPGFASQRKAYAATCGTESAFSVSVDDGATWDQTTLVDTVLSNILDVAASDGAATTTDFIITRSNASLESSLWRTQDNGVRWQRIFSSVLPGVDNFTLVMSAADQTGATLYLAGQIGAMPVVWQSTDAGKTFTARPSPCAVSVWVAPDHDALFVGGYDGAHGVVYHSTGGSVFFPEPAEVGARPLTCIIASPTYGQDGTVLVGNNAGEVFVSLDRGKTFVQVGQQLPLTTGIGRVSLAFDHDFNTNHVVYAATDAKVVGTSRARLFRNTIGGMGTWQSIHGSLPENAVFSRVCVGSAGALYALNTQTVLAADGKGGLLRSLTPSGEPAFEIVMRGLTDGTALNRLWVNGDRLWALVGANGMVSLTDRLAAPVQLSSPPHQTAGTGTETRLEWQTVGGATQYEWQISTDSGFGAMPAGSAGVTAGTSVSISGLKAGTVYHWRVRVTSPVHGPWSTVSSFTTRAFGLEVAPEPACPTPGATTPVRPLFQWKAVAGADMYDLLIATDPSFRDILVVRDGDAALPANAWQCDVDLAYGTTCFWKVRARTATSNSAWSQVSAFVTEPPPEPEPAPSPLPLPATPPAGDTVLRPTPDPPAGEQVVVVAPQTPAMPSANIIQFSIPGWALYAGLGLMLITVLLLGITLALLVARRK